jgi:hypothetical protein
MTWRARQPRRFSMPCRAREGLHGPETGLGGKEKEGAPSEVKRSSKARGASPRRIRQEPRIARAVQAAKDLLGTECAERDEKKRDEEGADSLHRPLCVRTLLAQGDSRAGPRRACFGRRVGDSGADELEFTTTRPTGSPSGGAFRPTKRG